MSVLDNHVLVLNKNWRIIGVTTVKDSVILMCRDAAYAVCTKTFNQYCWADWISADNTAETAFKIKSASQDIPAPEALILKKYDDSFHKSVVYSVANLYKRDENTCQYCGKKKQKKDLSIDHIIPRSRGGRSSWLNCVIACFSCNNKKDNKTPQEAAMSLIRQPFTPKWDPLLNVEPDCRPKSWQYFVKGE